MKPGDSEHRHRDAVAAEAAVSQHFPGLHPRDTDRHWHLGGLVYANRDDPAVLVHQRVGGSQWTVNLGHPIGRITGALLAALLLAALAAAVLDGIGILDLPDTQRL
ncbi:hypothetical protein SAMN05216270_107281 [Glycomyces harbinensis]|uniref:DUF5808 domain-containing protein n=1 Tax=Glycomyces harbinensis TaxID=58114 RepID=A0A1G6XRS0_9ACTN|nr:hypothetical protein SAMN05216270_107281 [Glycomyces harbinensis]